MKRIIVLFVVAFVSINGFAQTWLGLTTSNVNFREGPSVEYDVIKKLPKNTLLYIDSDDEVNGFYLAVDIENDEEGYVSTDYVKYHKDVEKTKGAAIQSVGTSTSYNPEIEVRNKTDVYMSLRINSTTYKFSPHETRMITIPPGRFSYRASSPGVIPAAGYYDVDSNHYYEWEFWIRTTRR